MRREAAGYGAFNSVSVRWCEAIASLLLRMEPHLRVDPRRPTAIQQAAIGRGDWWCQRGGTGGRVGAGGGTEAGTQGEGGDVMRVVYSFGIIWQQSRSRAS